MRINWHKLDDSWPVHLAGKWMVRVQDDAGADQHEGESVSITTRAGATKNVRLGKCIEGDGRSAIYQTPYTTPGKPGGGAKRGRRRWR